MKTSQLNPSSTQFLNQSPEMVLVHCQAWASSVRFGLGEIKYLRKLLRSYLFEPYDQETFERLQDFRSRLEQLGPEMQCLAMEISCHRNRLGGSMECNEAVLEGYFQARHRELEKLVKRVMGDFRQLRSEVFDFAVAMLARRRANRKSGAFRALDSIGNS